MLRENDDVKAFHLGVSEGGDRSFRSVKTNKRRKSRLA